MKNRIFLPLLMAALLIAGCAAPAASSAVSGSNPSAQSSGSAPASSSEAAASSGSTLEVIGTPLTAIPDDLFTDRDLNDSWNKTDCTVVTLSGTAAEISGKGAACTNGIVTISAAGDYLLSGELSGQIVVDANKEDKIRLILNGVSVTCENSAPVYVKQADKVIITLAEGTENTLTDGAQYVYDDTEKQEPSAALFSKDDLSLNGSGTLTITANCNNAIQGKDDVRISGGIYNLTAADKAIVGRDSLAISGGVFALNTQGDAVKATNDEDLSLGYLVISGGDFTVNAQQDAFSAETLLGITGGTFDITTAGGAVNNSTNGGGMWERFTEQTQEDTISAKGLKAGSLLLLQGGAYTMDVSDDAIHCNGDVTISGGTYQIATGDDGAHADAALRIEGGDMVISESYEGLEGANITLAGGNVKLNASDDGLNAAGGTDTMEMGGWRRGENPFASDAAYFIEVTGGEYYVNASGDGIDSNGNFTMTGGTVIVDGPENSGNGALDYGGSFDVNGGTLITSGMSGMAAAPSGTSEQKCVVMTFSSTLSGKTVTLQKADGAEILNHTTSKQGNQLILSSPELTAGESYVLSSGEISVEFALSEDAVTYLDENGVTTGGNGMMGGFGGGMMGGGRGDKPFGGMGGGKGNRGDWSTSESAPTAPDGSQLPDDFQMPEGMTPPDGFQMPEGMTPPDGFQMPEGMTPPDGFQMPEGITPPDGSAMPQGGMIPGGMPGQNPGETGV